MPPKHRLKNVIVAYPVTVPWLALFIRGVADYAKQHGGWNLTTTPPTLAGAEELAQSMHDLRGWPGDGVMAAITSPAEARAAKRLKIPVVSFSGSMQVADLPRVIIDNQTIGRIAAEHLLARGHRRLAYHGIKGVWYSEQRRLGFMQMAAEAGVPCEVLEAETPANSHASWQRRIAPLSRWLKGLVAPVGLLAAHDYRARVVLDECQRLGLNVPHDVAIIGVDNDLTVCEFCRPMLSSVSRNAWRMGHEAAAMLDALMDGREPPSREVLIPPDGIAARQSTDTVAIDDPHVAAAVHFMRDRIGEQINVAKIVEHCSISRRQLELRFQRVLGCSPLDYLCRSRVEKVKELLDAQQRLKLHAVAAACGFPSEERMRLVFRRLTGTTPKQFRQNLHRDH